MVKCPLKITTMMKDPFPNPLMKALNLTMTEDRLLDPTEVPITRVMTGFAGLVPGYGLVEVTVGTSKSSCSERNKRSREQSCRLCRRQKDTKTEPHL